VSSIAVDLGPRSLQPSPSSPPTMPLPEKYIGPALATVATAIVLALLLRKRGPRRPPYPPGPKGYPIIGNVFDFPRGAPWEGFARMAAEYGERRAFPGSHSRVGCLTWVGCRYRYIAPEVTNGFASGRAERQRCCHRATGTALGCILR